MERVSFHNAHHFVYGNMVHTKYKADFFLKAYVTYIFSPQEYSILSKCLCCKYQILMDVPTGDSDRACKVKSVCFDFITTRKGKSLTLH